MGDILHSGKFLLGKGIISGSIAYSFGRTIFKDSIYTRPEFNHAPALAIKIKLFEEVSFQTTLFANLNKEAIQPWTADYYYSISRFNWRPNTFSYGYENYVDNKYSDTPHSLYQKFLQGYYFVSYGHDLPKKIICKIKLDNTTNIRITYIARYAINYKDQNKIIHQDGKIWFGMSARYIIWRSFYVEYGLNFFPDENKRLPWDPDYTYGFGYFDWRPFKFSFSYGNWVVNRFGGNSNAYEYYGFWDGNFNISLNYVW